MMGYDWASEGSATGGGESEKIPAGKGIPVRIGKIVYGKKGGGGFKSKGNDPQIMAVFVDSEEREVAQMLTLSKKAGWVLARLLSRFGADVKGLTTSGIEPQHFAQKEIANTYLLGLRGRIDVVYNEAGYADVEPCERLPTNDGGKSTITEDDIPF